MLRPFAALTLASLASLGAFAGEDPVVAVINGHELRLSYVYDQIGSVPLGDQVDLQARLAGFVESLVREEALLQWMLSTDFEGEPALRDAVKAEVAGALIARHVRSNLDVSDEEVARYYDANSSVIRGEHVSARMIMKEDAGLCEAIRARIETEEDFVRIARAESDHAETAAEGGAIGQVMNHGGPLGFEPALFDLPVGGTAIFVNDRGCHVMMVTDRDTPPMPPLEEVATRIREVMLAERERALLGELLERAEAAVEVERRYDTLP